jgi:hypothetical protein
MPLGGLDPSMLLGFFVGIGRILGGGLLRWVFFFFFSLSSPCFF